MLEKIIIGSFGVFIGFVGKIVYDRYLRYADIQTKRKIAKQAQSLLEGMLIELDKRAGDDWSSSAGLYYKKQLAEEIRRLARDSRDAINGGIYFEMIRVVSGLEEFSMRQEANDSGMYSCDELIADINFLLRRFVPLYAKTKSEKEKEFNRIDKRIELMRQGVRPPNVDESWAYKVLEE